MHLPNSGFDKTLSQVKGQRSLKVAEEKPSRGPLTKEESERVRKTFRAAARYLLDGIDGKNRL